MTLSEHQRRFADQIGMLIQYAYSVLGWELTFGQAERSAEEHERMVNAGLSKARRSRHQDRLAVDFNLFIDGVYQANTEAHRPLGEFWESLDPHNVWGGSWSSFPDGNHYERSPEGRPGALPGGGATA